MLHDFEKHNTIPAKGITTNRFTLTISIQRNLIMDKSDKNQCTISIRNLASSEDEIVDVVGDWQDNEFRPYPQESAKQKSEDNDAGILNKTSKVPQKQSKLTEYYIVHKTPEDLLQKASTKPQTSTLTGVNRSNKLLMKAVVVLERLPLSSIKLQTLKKIQETKGRIKKNIELSKPICCTRKSRNTRVLSKNKSNVYHQLRNQYLNKEYECSFNTCTFTVKNWRLMYHHIKFTHIKQSTSEANVSLKMLLGTINYLCMKALVILERPSAHSINSQVQIKTKENSGKPCFMHPTSIKSKDLSSMSSQNQKLTSDNMKPIKVHQLSRNKFYAKDYPCSFNKCNFMATNWKDMLQHFKNSHIRLSCNAYSYICKPKVDLNEHIMKVHYIK